MTTSAQDGPGQALAGEVQVRYFAVLKDLTKVAEEQVPIGPGLRTVADLVRALELRHVALAGRLGLVRIARNKRLAATSDLLAAGDVIQLIPPLAGG
jgi:molybdopterin converting factor small subunit